MSTETKQTPDQPVQELEDVLPAFETVSADEVIDEDPELIKGVLRTGQKVLLIGASKTFKSHLAVDMALSLTQAGTEWLGNQVTSSCPVVYVNPEISSRSMRKRVQYMAVGSGKTKSMENLQLVNLRGYRLTITQVVSSLILRHRQRVAKGLPPVRAYVMDSIYYLMAGVDENSSNEVIDRILVELDRLIEQTGAAVIVVLHKNKSGSGSRFDSASGTGAWGRWADGTVTMTAIPSSDDLRYFKAEYDLRDLTPHKDTYFSCSIPHITLIDQADIPKKETKKANASTTPARVPTRSTGGRKTS